MAGAATFKGALRFGAFAQFAVRAKSAVKEEKIAFNQHHAADGGRLAQGSMVCQQCGENVTKDQIVKGFNGVAGIDEEYIGSLRADKTDLIEMDGLVPAEQIDPRWYQKSYDLVAEKGGEKGYVLFLRLLEKHGKVGIGKVVMGGKEFIVTVRPRAGVLTMELMYWPTEVDAKATTEEAAHAIAGVEVSAKELAMGDQLVKFLAADFDPSTYRNEQADAVAEYLGAFVAGKQPTPITKTKAASPVDDLTAALEASLAAAQAATDEKVAAKTGKPKPAAKAVRKAA